MKSYLDFYDRFKETCDIYILYILEAHFVEKKEDGTIIGGWPIGKQYNIPQHKTLEERQHMALQLQNEFGSSELFTKHTYIDHIENDVQNEYHLWPDGALLFNQNGLLVYQSCANNDGIRNTTWATEMTILLEQMI